MLLAVQGARDGSPSVANPSMVVPSTVHAAFHKAAHYFGVSARVVPGRRSTSARTSRRPPRPSTTRRCWWSAPRRRTRTASSTRSRSWLRWPPRAGSAATSTRASADGCCRTPPGSGAPCRRGRSRWRASPRSRSTPTSTATPRRARRCSCTGRRSCGGRSSSRPRTGRGTRCSTRRCSRPSPAVRSPARGRWCSTWVRPGYLVPGRCGLRGGRPDRRGRAVGAVGGRATGLDAGRAGVRLLLRCLHGVRRDEGAGLVRAAADVVRRRAADHPPVGLGGHAGVRRRAARRPGVVRGGRPGRRSGLRRPRAWSRSSRRSTRRPCPTRTSTACWPPPA